MSETYGSRGRDDGGVDLLKNDLGRDTDFVTDAVHISNLSATFLRMVDMSTMH